jgi:hypothetical protein
MMHARDVAKTPILKKIDRYLSCKDRRAQAFSALKSGHVSSLAEFLLRKGELSQPEIDEVRWTWYDDPDPGYWPDLPKYPSKKNIVRQGFLKALELAAETDLPIVTLWICSEEEFQAVVTRSDQQITLLLFTPPTPHWPARKGHKEVEQIWVIAGYPNAAEVMEASGFKGNKHAKNWTTRYTEKDSTGKTVTREISHTPVHPVHRDDGVFEVELYGEAIDSYQTGEPEGVIVS